MRRGQRRWGDADKRLTQVLDPRGYTVVPVAAPDVAKRLQKVEKKLARLAKG